MVVDTSAFLAVIFLEPHATWATEQFDTYAGRLVMSTVNLTEALIRVGDRNQPQLARFRQLLVELRIRFIAPDQVQAEIAAQARPKFRINLGDCFAYALARVEQCGIITIDVDFRTVDVQVVMP